VSNYLAIANVTEALRGRLEKQAKVIIADAVATVLRPDNVTPKPPSVNLFLYRVQPDAALRNADLPTRDADATLLQRPRAALDLHYLLTVHGDDKRHEPQRILGVVVRSLQSNPILTRKEITDAAADLLPGADNLVSDLADAVESVRFVPLPLSLEELSKLWSVFFQAKYALSVAYQASVVVIEGSDTPRAALPVRSANIVVRPSLGPVIDGLASQATPASPVVPIQPILAGYTLHILGRNLRGDNTRVRLGDVLVAPTTVRSDLVTLPLNDSSLRAGVTSVQIVQDVDFGPPSGLHSAFESNRAPFVLSPDISSLTATPAAVSMDVAPQVREGQRLVLALNDMGSTRAFTFSSTAGADAATISIPIGGVPGATYLVRLQVDGAESPLRVDGSGHYTQPQVTVP
jgi:hypothetical protein